MQNGFIFNGLASSHGGRNVRLMLLLVVGSACHPLIHRPIPPSSPKLPSQSAASGIALRSDHRQAFASAGSPLPGLMSPRVLASTGDEGKAFQRANAIALLSGSLTVRSDAFSISPRVQA